MLKSLSGRFLVLTILFVMAAQVVVFVPSLAHFRYDYLKVRLEMAQIASLSANAEGGISTARETELLETAGILNVVLHRDNTRQLELSSPVPGAISATFDLRDPGNFRLAQDALRLLTTPEDRVIRVIGTPVRQGGLLVEVTMYNTDLRQSLLDFGQGLLLITGFIATVTAGLLFLAVQIVMVRPIKRAVAHMKSYAKAPEDVRQIVMPTAGINELRDAEDAMREMQTEVTGALKQKERLAQLGRAVAKVSHDLRNMLTSAQLFTDSIETSEDPLVKRIAPKLVNSITRATSLCEATLAFGRVDEPAPKLEQVSLAHLVDDVVDSERLASSSHDVTFTNTVSETMMVTADAEQLYRVLSNLVRNARQAVIGTGQHGEISVHAAEDDDVWYITIADTGPGIPTVSQEFLFEAFQGSTRKGGSGLGLAIAAELIRGHGGQLDLKGTDHKGTQFVISLPKTIVPTEPKPITH